MKHLKKLEEIIYQSDFANRRVNRPKENDYVLIDCDQNNFTTDYKDFKMFIDTHIGQILNISSIFIRVKYKNIPENIKDWFADFGGGIYYRPFEFKDVIAYSKNKKELEHIIITKNYNL